MSFADNPFIVLTYVSGPAVLTNASVLLLLSTSNRFARSIDRSRILAEGIAKLSKAGREELAMSGRRVQLTALTMSSLYVASATFALATLMTLAGAAFENLVPASLFYLLVGGAVVFGIVGLGAFVVASATMVIESRLAMRAVMLEASAALALIEKMAPAVH